VTPPTLYLPPRHSEDTRLLWRAATARGWDTLRLQGWRVAPHQHPPGPALVYGEPLFAATVADQLQLALLEPPLDWLANLPRDLLQREVRAGTLAQLLTWPAPAFAKPADDKRFPAAVYDDLANIPGLAHLDPDSPTLWSQPASFTLEVRAFVLDQHTMTASAYARNGALAVEPPAHTPELPHALAFLTAALPRLSLPPAVVVDVGLLSTGAWAIIEANPCWGAGLYACDPDAALDVIARAARPLDALTPQDAPWRVSRALPT
jgi:hypothetical protein